MSVLKGLGVTASLKPARLKLMVALLATLVVSSVVHTGQDRRAEGHGATPIPGSRTYLCYVDGHLPTGEIRPANPACEHARNVGGTQPFYDWFGVLRSDGLGRTRGFIPDGALCSAGLAKYAGFDAPRGDWPLTHLTPGARLNLRRSHWAAYPGWVYLYLTKDGYQPNQVLTWKDMQKEPFYAAEYHHRSPSLPAGKTGRHVIYTVWKRSDSDETFYGCSDVIFDGGNGEVTGIRTSARQGPALGAYR